MSMFFTLVRCSIILSRLFLESSAKTQPLTTCELGIRFKPDPKKGFKCYCDADFSGLWNKAFAPVDPSTKSCKVDGSSSMQDALYPGLPNSNPKLHSPPPRLSTLQCHKL